MVTETRIFIDGKNEGQSPQELHSTVNFNANKFSSKSQTAPQTTQIDEVIYALENAYENRRARQVVKWERMPRPNFPLSV